MSHQAPPELARLLAASDSTARDRAWEALLAAYSPLLLSVARAQARDRDAAMDAYAYVLERLREEDYRRLRAWVADGRSRFSTWLVVVARRLCLDHHRHRYGRVRTTADTNRAQDRRRERFRLTDLLAEELDVAFIAAEPSGQPDAHVRRTQLRAILRSELARLDERDRLLLRLRFQDDIPVRESAERLGLPTPFHVYRSIRRVLDGMRERLERRGVLDPSP